jgi:intein/homing endonuclease
MDLTSLRKRTGSGGPTMVFGAVTTSNHVIEAFRHRHDRRTNNLVLAGESLLRSDIDVSWLPAASETYSISADPRDYVLADIPIVTVDIPNRNLQAFPYEEVSYFDPLQGRMVYQTFEGRPTHIDHDNKDPLKAKGVMFDSALQYVPAYNVWKIRILAGWDRTKDPMLVRQILSKKRTGYSMGALVENFVPLVAGTLVNTEDGWVPIESVRPGKRVMTVHGLERSGGAVLNGYAPTVMLETETGLELDAALNHPILALRPDLTTEWREAGDVAVGDYVAVSAKPGSFPERLDFDYVPLAEQVDRNGTAECAICNERFGHIGKHVRATHRISIEQYIERHGRRVLNPTNLRTDITYPSGMTDELAALLGYFVAEGSWGESGILTPLTNTKPNVTNHFADCFRQTFGIDPPNTAGVPLGIRDFYQYLGVGQGYATDKAVPWSIMQAPRSAVVSFLRAYWEGDGSARWAPGTVSFHTASKQLAQGIQLLLLSLAIPTQRSETRDRRYPDNHYYNVCIWGRHVDSFIETVGCTSDERQQDLARLSTRRQITQYGETIPNGIPVLNELYRKHHQGKVGTPYYKTATGETKRLSLHRLDLKNNAQLAYGHFERWDDLLPNICELDPELAERIAGLLDSRLAWVRVTGKELSHIQQPCYCVRDVENGHNFLAEGYVVHNCSVCGAVDTNIRKCACMRKGKGNVSGSALTYQVCCGTNFIECSSVDDPADITADTDNLFD